MEALNILALWGVPKEILLLGAGGIVIVVGAIAAWFFLGDSEETGEDTEKPKKEKKANPSKEDKQRAKELKKQQKLAAKEAKAQAKESKPKKEKKPRPAKAPKAVKVKAKKEKKVKAVKPAKAKKPPKPKKGKSIAKASHKITAGQYEYVTKLVHDSDSKSILFASCDRQALPVSIPVKVAIQIAMDSKCLLIDLDVRRDAVAKAFDLEDTPNPKHLRPMPYKTSFENLFIWPSHNFVRSGHMNIKSLVHAAEDKYDHVLISCPCLNVSPDRKLIASSAEKVFIFSNNDTDAGYLTDLIRSRGSDVFANIEVVSEDEEPVIEDMTETKEDTNLNDPLGIGNAGDDADLAELEDLIAIEPDDAVQETVADDGINVDAEIDIEANLDDLLGGDENAEIDPGLIDDLFDEDQDK
ncbi:MAG: hypothetical protein KAJ07_10765 [Planctomycetes bacterium]|nr:hypothetical protein [Planctomycetota bacterium]